MDRAATGADRPGFADRLAGQELSAKSCQALYSGYEALAAAAPKVAKPRTAKPLPEMPADLAAARKSGLTKSWSAGYMEPLRSSALRAEVQARTLQAIQSGELKAINAEVYDFRPASPAAGTLAAR